MSTTTTSGTVDQDSIRVANRYADQINRHESLLGRAGACRTATAMYRRDARDSADAAEQHRRAARTIADVNVAAEHARQARLADDEARRETMAARLYEAQAESYEAHARQVGA